MSPVLTWSKEHSLLFLTVSFLVPDSHTSSLPGSIGDTYYNLGIYTAKKHGCSLSLLFFVCIRCNSRLDLEHLYSLHVVKCAA